MIHDFVFILGLIAFGVGLYFIDPVYAALGVGSILMLLGLAMAQRAKVGNDS